MIKNQKPKQAEKSNKKIVESNTYLETDKAHKKWYDSNNMGKMRGKPTDKIKETKKDKGTAKHSLRKEKGK